MKLTIRIIIIWISFLLIELVKAETLRENTLRTSARNFGIVQPYKTYVKTNPAAVKAGKLLFESKLLSPDNNISCSTCHIDKFGSSDGLSNAVGVGGEGNGKVRINSPGKIIPRNTLMLEFKSF